MNRRKILLALIPAGAIIALAGPSQADPRAPLPAVGLPEAGELPGFSLYFERRASERGGTVGLLRKSDGLRLLVSIVVHKTPESARGYPARHNAGISLKGAGLKKVTRPRRVIGQELWSNRDKLPGPFRFVAIDGRSLVNVLVEPPISSGPRGFAVRHASKQRDVTLAENLAAAVLERLTALGLTSRPAGSASARAQQEIKARLQR